MSGHDRAERLQVDVASMRMLCVDDLNTMFFLFKQADLR